MPASFAILLSTRQLVNGATFPELLNGNGGIVAKRTDSGGYAIQFVAQPYQGAVALGTPTTLIFGAKVVGDDEGSYVFSNYNPGDGLFDFVLTGAGATAVYTVNPTLNTVKLNNLLGYGPNGFAEVTELRSIPDVAGSLDGDFFVLQDKAGSVGVWIALNNGATAEPAGAIACHRAIKVTTINTGDTAGTVATKLATALSADTQYTAAASGDLVTITDLVIGARPDPGADGNTGFELDRWITGAAPNALSPVPSVILDGEITWTENGARTSTLTFPIQVFFAVNNGGEGAPQNGTPAYPAPGAIAPRPTFQAPIAIAAAVAQNLFAAPGAALASFSMLVAEIDAAAGAGAYTGAFTLPDNNMVAGAIVKLNVALAASANPTVTISDAAPTLLASITNPAPGAAASWYGEFKYDGAAWHKTFSLFQ